MRSFEFVTYDVFTTRRFGGNPLAVLHRADGLKSEEMQAIAAEFNFSESTFVLPSIQGMGPRVRIFTPKSELPFAGHPTVGTAMALRELGRLKDDNAVLEQAAGPVAVSFEPDGSVRFKAPGTPVVESFGTREDAARALGLQQQQILSDPMRAGAGLAFPFVELADLDTLATAELTSVGTPFDGEVACFVRIADSRLRVRLFAPAHGIVEDPATGSAAAGLASLLAQRSPAADAELEWRIEQGIEMGRPSRIDISVHKRQGEIECVFVAGSAIKMTEGVIHL